MTPSTRSFSKRSRVLAGAAAVSAVAGAFLLGGLAPAQAQESAPGVAVEDVSVAGIRNGYFIHNNSSLTLTLLEDKTSQPNENGFGDTLPTVIQPHADPAYFDVKVWFFTPRPDDTTLVYEASRGGEVVGTVTFHANVSYNPQNHFFTDNSDTSTTGAVQSFVNKSDGRGDGHQTRFEVTN